MGTLTRNDQALAICILVLWSFGLIFAPYAEAVFASASAFITLAYLALHVLVFCYTLYLSLELVRSTKKKKLHFSAWVVRAALYAYVLVALIYSASLSITLLQ